MLARIKTFLFENQTLRQTVAKNTFWLGVGQIGGRLLRMVIIIYAARVLGAEGWGVFSYAINLTALLTIFVDFGITPVLARSIATAKEQSDQNRIISTSFFIKAALLTLGVIIVIFIGPLATKIEAAKPLLALAALIMVFDALREFSFSIIRATEKMELEAGLFTLTNLSVVGFGFLFLTFSPTVGAFTYSYVLGTGIGMTATIFTLRNYFKSLVSNFSTQLIKPILSSALPIAISSLLGSLMINTDVFLIGLFRSAAEVGYYSAAQRPIQLLYLLPTLLGISVFPAFSRFAQTDKERMRSLLERSLAVVLLAAIPITVGGIILAPSLIILLFGSAYLPAISSFQVLLLTVIAAFPAILLNNALFAYGKEKILIKYVIIGNIVNIVGDLILIPKIGIVGSAWITLLSQIISNGYLVAHLRRANPFTVFKYLPNIALANVFLAAVVWPLAYIGMNPLFIILIAILVYFAVLYKKREPLLKEIKQILVVQQS